MTFEIHYQPNLTWAHWHRRRRRYVSRLFSVYYRRHANMQSHVTRCVCDVDTHTLVRIWWGGMRTRAQILKQIDILAARGWLWCAFWSKAHAFAPLNCWPDFEIECYCRANREPRPSIEFVRLWCRLHSVWLAGMVPNAITRPFRNQ